jgi:hypothetical protein
LQPLKALIWKEFRRDLQRVRNIKTSILYLEEDVFWYRCTSVEETQRIGECKIKAQADVFRLLFGKCHAQGCSLKKVVSTGER